MQSFIGQNKLSMSFKHANIDYSFDLVEGKKSNQSVFINGKHYEIDCKQGSSKVVLEILKSCSLGSATSEEELMGRLSIHPDITFPEVGIIDNIGKIGTNILYSIIKKLYTEESKNQTFLSKFCDAQTNLFHDSFDRVFIATNELNWENTLESLKKEPIKGNTGIYTSGLFALDLAASARAASTIKLENIIIVDIAPVVRDFWEETEDIIKNSDNRFSAKLSIESLIVKKKEIYFPENSDTLEKNSIETIEQNFQRGLSFLSTDEQYSKVKEIFDNDRFVFILGNLLDQEMTKKLGDILKKNSYTVDTLYISNIYGLLANNLEDEYKDKQNAYAETLKIELSDEITRRNNPSFERDAMWNKPIHEKIALVEKMFGTDEKSKKIFLLNVSELAERRKVRNDHQIKNYEYECEQFFTSMKNIVGEAPKEYNLIHSSRSCDKGCCRNPQRLDKPQKTDNIKEILSKKTPCHL